MKRLMIAVTAVVCAFFLTASFNTADAQKGKGKKFKAVCPVSGKPCKKDFSVEHNGGKVYFCCPMCPGAFKSKTKKFAAKANHQMVGTGQFVLAKCPFTGKKLNPATKINVKGVNVCFCCFMCQGKAKKAKGAKRINAIFNDKAFKKGFQLKKSE